MGMLIEHFAGAFPLWLAPEQVRVLVVSQKVEEYGRQVERQLAEAGLRVTGDYRAEKIGAKIRDAQLELIPYMFVIGGREADEGKVAVRDRLRGRPGGHAPGRGHREASGRDPSEDRPADVVRRSAGISERITSRMRTCALSSRLGFGIRLTASSYPSLTDSAVVGIL